MSEPIRVLQMIASLYSGGSQAMLMNIYRNIDRTKVQFDFIVEHPEYDYYLSEIESLGGKVYTLPAFKGSNLKEVKDAWNKFFIEHPEYKILHSHSRSHASIYLPIARKYGLKTIIHSHNTSNGSGIKAIVKNIMQYPLRFQADYYIGCSIKAGEWLFGERIINSDKFFVLNNAIDADKYRFNEKIREEYRKEFNVIDKTVYLQVGSLSKQKNHLFSIEVFNKLSKVKDNVVLYVAGVGDLKQDIEVKIKEYGLEEKVILLGRRSDISNLLQMADCYIMPSIYEGLSVAAVEAEASGITCILSDTVSKEVKISDNCEFLPLEVDKWVDRLNNSFNRIDSYKQVKDAGYDAKDSAKKMQEFYEGLIND